MNREIEQLPQHQKEVLLYLIDLHKKFSGKQIVVNSLPFRSGKRYFMNEVKKLIGESNE